MHPDLENARLYLAVTQSVLRTERRLHVMWGLRFASVQRAEDRLCKALDHLWAVQERLGADHVNA